MATLLLWGCGQEEEKAAAPMPETSPAVTESVDLAEETAQTEGAVEEAPPTVGETAAAAVETVQEKVAAAKEVVREKAAVVVEKSEKAAAEIKEAVAKPTTTLESVTLDNSYGKIILPHKAHAEAHGCIPCHGTDKPGPLSLGKDAGHALCQGCHKAKQAGPTSCTQCHQKKAKAIEGC
jgi:hypothetical protein